MMPSALEQQLSAAYKRSPSPVVLPPPAGPDELKQSSIDETTYVEPFRKLLIAHLQTLCKVYDAHPRAPEPPLRREVRDLYRSLQANTMPMRVACQKFKNIVSRNKYPPIEPTEMDLLLGLGKYQFDTDLYFDTDERCAMLQSRSQIESFMRQYEVVNFTAEDIRPEKLLAFFEKLFTDYLTVLDIEAVVHRKDLEIQMHIETEKRKYMKWLNQLRKNELGLIKIALSMNKEAKKEDVRTPSDIVHNILWRHCHAPRELCAGNDVSLGKKIVHAGMADRQARELKDSIGYYRHRIHAKETKHLWARLRPFMKFIVYFKKLRRERKGREFNCFMMSVFDIEDHQADYQSSLDDVQQLISEQAATLKNGEKKRIQLFLDVATHAVPVDIELSRDGSGKLIKRCLIMDAASEPRAEKMEGVFKRWGFDVFWAGTPGEQLQKDHISCALYGINMLAKAADDPDLYTRLDKIRARPNRDPMTEEQKDYHVISWIELGVDYFKFAASHRYLHTLPQDVLSARASRQYRYTLADYLKTHTIHTVRSEPGFLSLWSRDVSIPKNAVMMHKMMAYMQDAEFIMAHNSAEDIAKLLDGKAVPGLVLPPNVKGIDNPSSAVAYRGKQF